MLTALVLLLRTLGLLCSGPRAVAPENLALRQQLSVFRRTVRRPPLRTSDRLFWVLLAKAWRDWRTAVIVVQPDTVVRGDGAMDFSARATTKGAARTRHHRDGPGRTRG